MRKHDLEPRVREQVESGLDGLVEEFEPVASPEEV